jgi:lipooligosaccharide transport system permease protein
MTAPVLTRVVPAELLASRRSQRMIERSYTVHRKYWFIFVTGFFEPILYLLSMQVGFSSLIGEITVDGVTYEYAEFVAPALMAVAAMNGAIFDSTVTIFLKLRNKTYDSILATPMSAADVAVGEIGWAMLRGLAYSTAFIVAMVVLGMVGSPMIVFALVSCALVGMAFSAVGMALTTYMRSWTDFDYILAVTIPLMLFSATFFPASSYGDWQWLVYLSPLYHGVNLTRNFNVGNLEWEMLLNVGVLVALAAVGLRFTARRIEGLLLT